MRDLPFCLVLFEGDIIARIIGYPARCRVATEMDIEGIHRKYASFTYPERLYALKALLYVLLLLLCAIIHLLLVPFTSFFHPPFFHKEDLLNKVPTKLRIGAT